MRQALATPGATVARTGSLVLPGLVARACQFCYPTKTWNARPFLSSADDVAWMPLTAFTIEISVVVQYLGCGATVPCFPFVLVTRIP